MNKKYLFLAVFAALFLAIMFSVIRNLSTEKSTERNKIDRSLSEIQQQYDEINKDLFKVIGEFICLPLKDEAVPHNDLCAFGIKNSDGGYYRLQSMSDDKFNLLTSLNKGQKIEVSGELINEESEIYKTLGTINVLGVKHLEAEKEPDLNLPTSFKASYISFSDYISNVFTAEQYPKLESWVENGEIECQETPLESSLPLRIGKRVINGQKYCIAASSEGAAGSVYTQYSYSTVIENNVYIINFVARYVNCSNYPELEAVRCQQERENFNLDNLVDLEVRQIKNL